MLFSLSRRWPLALAALAPLGLAGCSSFSSSSPETLFGLLSPYRIEIVQGNVVTLSLIHI